MKNTLILVVFLAACTGSVLPGIDQKENTQVAAGECDCTVHNALADGGTNDADASSQDASVDDGGTDAGPPPPPPVVASGTRLKVIFMTSTDGLRIPKSTSTFFDAQLQAKCSVADLRTASRCVPLSVASPNDQLPLFMDSVCTQQLALLDTSVTVPVYVKIADPVDGAFFVVNARGDEYMGSLFKKENDGSCTAYSRDSLPGNQKAFLIGADATASFAEVAEEISQ